MESTCFDLEKCCIMLIQAIYMYMYRIWNIDKYLLYRYQHLSSGLCQYRYQKEPSDMYQQDSNYTVSVSAWVLGVYQYQQKRIGSTEPFWHCYPDIYITKFERYCKNNQCLIWNINLKIWKCTENKLLISPQKFLNNGFALKIYIWT